MKLKKSGAKCRRCGSTLAWMIKGATPRSPWICVSEPQCKRRQRARTVPLPTAVPPVKP